MHAAWSVARERTGTEHLLEDWPVGSLEGPVEHFIFREINEKLAETAAPRIYPHRRGEMYVVPNSLLGALYILFATEVSGRTRSAIRCPGCNEFFVPVHGRQKHCSNACRQRTYDLRKREKEATSNE